MPDFVYTGRRASGDAVRGRLEAASATEVATYLNSRGVTPVAINEAAVTSEITVQDIWRKLGGGKSAVGYPFAAAADRGADNPAIEIGHPDLMEAGHRNPQVSLM